MKKVFLATVLAGGLLSPNLSHADLKGEVNALMDKQRGLVEQAINLSQKHVADGREALTQIGHPLANAHLQLNDVFSQIREMLIKGHLDAVAAHQNK